MRAAFPGATILHPAAITGVEDRLLNSYVRLMMNLPILPLVGAPHISCTPTRAHAPACALSEVGLSGTSQAICARYWTAHAAPTARGNPIACSIITIHDPRLGALRMTGDSPVSFCTARGILLQECQRQRCGWRLQVGGGAARVQPVYVRDVTEAFMEVLKTKDSIGRSYDLAGPRSFT